MHPAKRRRLDQSSATLTKPFSSPLRLDWKKQLTANRRSDELNSGNVTPKSPSTSITTERSSLSPSQPSTSNAEYVALRKQYVALSKQLNKLRQSLDVAQQALRIESSDKNIELEALILKWRDVARDAADELFPVAQDQVRNTGGVSAWRKERQVLKNDWKSNGQSSHFEILGDPSDRKGFGIEEDRAEAIKYGLAESRNTDRRQTCSVNRNDDDDDDSDDVSSTLSSINFSPCTLMPFSSFWHS